MKKIAYLLIISLLFTLLPVESAQAATKVSGPTVTAVYDKKLDDFKYKFSHSNKNAKIYYRDCSNIDRRWKQIKNGATVKMPWYCKSSDIYVYAQVGKTKSKARRVSLWDVDDKTVDSLIKKEMSKVVSKGDNKVTKFMKLLVYFKQNYDYIWLDDNKRDSTKTKTFYRRGGMCWELANTFERYCKVLGIKAETVDDDSVDYKYSSNHAWNHVYLDQYPIIVDPTSVVMVDSINNYGTIFTNQDSIAKSKFKLTSSKALLYKFAGSYEVDVEDTIWVAEEYAFDAILSEQASDIKISNNKISYIWNEPADPDYGTEAYTVRYEMRYYPEDGYWYGFTYDLDGNLLHDGKAEVDAWYAAHPEVERK